MNDYFSRGELSPVERSATRQPSAVSAIQPASASANVRQGGKPPTPPPNGSADENADPPEGGIASSAEYAKVHARIAELLSALRTQGNAVTVDGAAEEIQSMIPAPIVLVPLPPASREAVESSIRIARRIAEQASYAYAAQANVRRGVADQIISAAM